MGLGQYSLYASVGEVRERVNIGTQMFTLRVGEYGRVNIFVSSGTMKA